jgi:hypothetical protein
MGKQRGGNGDNVPPEGDRPPDPDLPELPAELTIPDDLSELGDEVERIRSELALERRLPGSIRRPARTGEPSIGLPLLIMSVAVLITLVSLFVMAWSGTDSGIGDAEVPTSAGGVTQLPPITLTDAGGQPVSLAGQLPMVLMLVESCDCGALLAETVEAAPPGVTVAAIGSDPPSPPPADPDHPAALLLADPNGLIRGQLGLGPPTDAASVVLVAQDGRITQSYPAATGIGQYQNELADLSPSA